jgi:tetratricopeptide (TPR) repeat protein
MKLWALLACAAILAAGIAAWSNSLNGPFIFDDPLAIRDNPTLRQFPAWENLAPPQANPLSRRPVVNLAFAANRALSGPGVRGFHVGNLLIHLLAALTLFGIVRRTMDGGRRIPDEGRSAPEPRAIVPRPAATVAVPFAVALIWAVHPLLTEPVDYLTQRTELLLGLFLLLTLYCAIRGAASGHPGRWNAAAIAACALGMGSKEVMAVTPILVLLYDRCFLSGSFRQALRRRLPLHLGLAATWAILGALLIAYPWGGKTGAGFGLPAIGAWEYARTQPGVIVHYLRLSFWPASLCLDYAWPIAKSADEILPQAAVIAALLAGTLWALRRAPAFGFLGAWFFLILAPTSSLMPILDPAVERRMYLPLAAVVTACVLAAYALGGRCLRRAAESAATRKLLASILAAVALIAAAAALGYRTFERNADYREPITLWKDTVRQRPENARAWNNLGCAHDQAGDAGAAVLDFNRAIHWAPRYADAWNNRGADFLKAHRLAEALRDLDQAIELNSGLADAYQNRGCVRLSAGQYPQALADFTQAVNLKPDWGEAYTNRGIAHYLQNQLPEAVQDLDRAIALQPRYAYAYLNRASVLHQMKEYALALSDLQTFEQLGGRPPPEFVEVLLRDAGRVK